MTSARTEPRAGSGGFALVELLVAMTLLALLMALLFAGVRLGQRAWEVSDAWADRLDRLGVLENFLRTQLSEVQAAARRTPSGGQIVLFEGEPGSLSFVAPMFAPLAVGGLYLVTLSSAGNSTAKRLTLSWRPYGPPGSIPAGREPGGPVTLLDAVTEIDFAYGGPPGAGQPLQWSERWSGADHLPSLVRLRLGGVGAAKRNWPDLVVALRMVPPVPAFQ
jgi:general secretion pathway protein J